MIDPEALAQTLADLAFPSGNQLGLTLDDMQSQLPTHCRVIAGHLCDDAEARGRLVATLLETVNSTPGEVDQHGEQRYDEAAIFGPKGAALTASNSGPKASHHDRASDRSNPL